MNLTPTKVELLCFAVALTFFWTILNATGRGWTGWYRLAKTGRVAVATIADIEPKQHQGCSFKFMVGAITYHGSADGCSSHGVGAELQITFLATDPTFVSTRDAYDELRSEVFGPLALSVVGGLISGWRYSRRQAM